MFYKPTYCCSCGDKIERIEWHILTNRRFCKLCETEHKFGEWMFRLLGAVLVTFGVYGVGTHLVSDKKPFEVAHSQNSASRRIVSDLKSVSQEKNKESHSGNRLDSLANSERRSRQTAKDISERQKPTGVKRLRTPQKVVSESVYFCGGGDKKRKPVFAESERRREVLAT